MARQAGRFKVGILPLAVAPDPQSLKITLTANPTQAEPGQPVTYDVLVTDLSGQSIAAELSLDLVDKAVLELCCRAHRRDPRRSTAGASLIITASGLSLSAERFQQQFEQDLDASARSAIGRRRVDHQAER